MELVHFRPVKVKEFLRKARRDWIASQVVRNGEALRRLIVDRTEYRLAGITDPVLDQEIERRERRRDELLARLKED